MNDQELGGLDLLYSYKNQLIDDLLTDKTVRHLMSDDHGEDLSAGELIYSQVFPYEYVPDTVEEAKTFICCEVDIPAVDDKTFIRPTIYIWLFTHKSKVRLKEGGLRIDNLTSRVAKLINRSRMYGLGELQLASIKRFSPIANYQGRVLTFKARDFNQTSPTGMQVPSRRRG